MTSRLSFCSPRPTQRPQTPHPGFYSPFPDDNAEAIALYTPLPLRERSFAESMNSEEVDMIKAWLDDENEKNGLQTPSPSPKKTPIFRSGSPSAKQSPRLLPDPFGGSYFFYDIPSPYAQTGVSPSSLSPAAPTSPVSMLSYSPLKYDPFFQSLRGDNAESPVLTQLNVAASTSPSSSNKENRASSFAVYHEHPVASSAKRSVLADISKSSDVEFVPHTWLSLYHHRPHATDPVDVQRAWVMQALQHLRTNATFQTPSVLTHVGGGGLRATPISPLTVPSALQSARAGILKNRTNNLSGSGVGARSVRFQQPLTTVKRVAPPPDTPTTWPPAVPSVPTGHTADRLFWPHHIPYQTPEHASSSSSGSSGADNISTESHTTVLLSGKENASHAKSVPSTTLAGKKLEYTAPSERILNEIL